MTKTRYYVRVKDESGEWQDGVRNGQRNFETLEEADSLMDSAVEKDLYAVLFSVEDGQKPVKVRSVRPGTEL